MSHFLIYFGLLACFDFGSTTNPPICKIKECLSYRVLQKKSNYEIREYNIDVKRLHINTIRSIDPSKGIEARRRLYKAMIKVAKAYLNGNNSKKISVSNALPIIDIVGISKDHFMQGLLIFLPKSVVSPPEPLDESLHLRNGGKPGKMYAVRLNNSPTFLDIKLAARKLRNDLKADGIGRGKNRYQIHLAKYAENIEETPKTVDVMYMF